MDEMLILYKHAIMELGEAHNYMETYFYENLLKKYSTSFILIHALINLIRLKSFLISLFVIRHSNTQNSSISSYLYLNDILHELLYYLLNFFYPIPLACRMSQCLLQYLNSDSFVSIIIHAINFLKSNKNDFLSFIIAMPPYNLH